MKNRSNRGEHPTRRRAGTSATTPFSLCELAAALLGGCVLITSGCSRSDLAPDRYYTDAGVQLNPLDVNQQTPRLDPTGTGGSPAMPPDPCEGNEVGQCARRAVGEYCVGGSWVRCAETSAGCTYEAELVPGSPICSGPEICGNRVDDNLDGKVDCEDTACHGAACPELCDDGVDNDGDGSLDCSDADCAAVSSCMRCSASAVLNSTLNGNTREFGDLSSSSCGGIGAPEQHISWIAPAAGCFSFDTLGSEFDTVLYAKTDCESDAELACNDDGPFGDVASSLQLSVAQGQAIALYVDGYAGEAGRFQLSVAACQEDCSNGVDDDLDGRVDCADSDCSAHPLCVEPGGEVDCGDGLDNDGDGAVDCADADCAGLAMCLLPEDCHNGVDDDLNGRTDCADPVCDTDAVCAGCPLIDADLGSALGQFSGETGGASALENTCGGELASPEVVYQWSPPQTGCFELATEGSSFDTVLSLRSPCPEFEQLECNDDRPSSSDGDSLVRWYGDVGELVAVVVDGFSESQGAYVLTISECVEVCDNNADDDLDGLSDCADDECVGAPGCQLEICGNGVDDDANGAIDCADASCAALAECTEICDNGVDDNNDGLVDCAADECADSSACEMCLPTTALPSAAAVVVQGDTSGGVNHIGATCGSGARSADVVYSWRAPTTGCFRLDTEGSEMDTVLHVHTGCPQYAQTNCDDDTTGVTSRVELDVAVADTEYIIVVDGFGSRAEGPYTLTISPCP